VSHQPIEDTQVFQCFVEVAQQGWNLVQPWDSFAKSTLGKQLVRSLDSIGANLVEGDGRYGTGEGIHFFVLARASARESRYWLTVAEKRNLVSPPVAEALVARLEVGLRMSNSLITYRRSRAAKSEVREERPEYGVGDGDGDEHLTPNTQHLTPNTQSLK
jgi:four helix bundle protein